MDGEWTSWHEQPVSTEKAKAETAETDGEMNDGERRTNGDGSF